MTAPVHPGLGLPRARAHPGLPRKKGNFVDPLPLVKASVSVHFFFALSQAASAHSRRTPFFSPRSKIYEFNYDFEGPPAKPAHFFLDFCKITLIFIGAGAFPKPQTISPSISLMKELGGLRFRFGRTRGQDCSFFLVGPPGT